MTPGILADSSLRFAASTWLSASSGASSKFSVTRTRSAESPSGEISMNPSTFFRRNRFLYAFDVLFDFAHLWMHVLNQFVSCFRNLLHPFGHFVQLFYHCLLPRGNAMHPSKTNAPAGH